MEENEYDRENFIRIGQSLDTPGEIVKEQLKRVPKKSWMGDNRRPFFTENANSQKYYYMPIGDVPQHPHRNTLVPLGTFLGFDDVGTDYYMRFSNPPYNNSEHGHISMNTHPLVYTDKPQDDASMPLTYRDYIREFYPEQLTNGGKKHKIVKNRKSKRTRKYKKKSKRLNKN